MSITARSVNLKEGDKLRGTRENNKILELVVEKARNVWDATDWYLALQEV